MMFLSFSFSLPSPLSKKSINKILKKKREKEKSGFLAPLKHPLTLGLHFDGRQLPEGSLGDSAPAPLLWPGLGSRLPTLFSVYT